MRVCPARAAMPGATPAGGTAVEPAGSFAWRRASANVSRKSRWRRSATARARSSTKASASASSSSGTLEDLRQALGGEVVVRGAEPAADHQQVRVAAERVPQGGDEPLAVVGDRQEFRDLDAAPAEVVADEGAVGVPGAPVQQFVAAEDHGGARRSRRHQLLVPGMRITPRAFMK